MTITPIFAHTDTREGIHSIHLPGEIDCEFDKLYYDWTDVEYIVSYCKENSAYLSNEFFDGATVDDVIDRVIEEADSLFEYFSSLDDNPSDKDFQKALSLFQPLSNNEVIAYPLQSLKVKYRDKNIRKPVLRLYAVRVDNNMVVITGGAIKMSDTMQGHPDTEKEKKKISRVRDCKLPRK